MKKLLFFLPVFLLALPLDFSKCYEKYSFIKNLIPVTSTKSVTFYPQKNYLFYDPFTKLYVIKANNPKVVKFYDGAKLGWWMAAIKSNGVYGGTYASKAKFLNTAKLSVNAPSTSVVSDLFCRAYGVGNGGFLPKKYLMHFVKYGYWGDIGVEVNDDMVVTSVDPFYAKGIKIGDKILKINLKKATPETFTNYIILSPANRAVTIKTNKGSYLLQVRKKTYNFTPLVHYGIYVDENLYVTKMPKWMQNKFFKNKPVKIYAVNGKKVNNIQELRRVLSSYKNVTITFIQNGLKVKIPLRK